eukprot:Clim_evm14s248 gene=Clim_evmTU14s248
MRSVLSVAVATRATRSLRMRIATSQHFGAAYTPFSTTTTKRWQERVKKEPVRRPVTLFYSDYAEVPMPEGHRFPMHKYRMVRETLQKETEQWVAKKQTEAESTAAGGDDSEAHGYTSFDDVHKEDQWRTISEFKEAPYATEADLLLAHSPDYVRRVLANDLTKAERRRIGIPSDSPEAIARALASTGGTVAALHAAMRSPIGLSAQVAGGTHHAGPDFGAGFCVFNDLAVAARVALRDYPNITKVLVLDLDVHQGDGTAQILGAGLGEEEDKRICTFSMHGRTNFPLRKSEKGTFDVELDDDMEDTEYLSYLAEWIPLLFQMFQPQLVFYQAGVDPLKEDSLGKLSLTRDGLKRRNAMVYSACHQQGARLVVTMGGGYTKPIDTTVECHADVYRQLLQHAAKDRLTGLVFSL